MEVPLNMDALRQKQTSTFLLEVALGCCSEDGGVVPLIMATLCVLERKLS